MNEKRYVWVVVIGDVSGIMGAYVNEEIAKAAAIKDAAIRTGTSRLFPERIGDFEWISWPNSDTRTLATVIPTASRSTRVIS
jgi:hypothetical protein